MATNRDRGKFKQEKKDRVRANGEKREREREHIAMINRPKFENL